MTWMHRRLALALALSLLLHLLPLVPGWLPPPPESERQPPLEAHLRPPPAAPQAPLLLPEPPPPATAAAARPAPKPEKARKPKPEKTAPPKVEWAAEVKRQLKELDRQGKFYPEEARAQGLEGEAVVLLLLDEAGNAVAARIEQSSGHKLLDDAALRAARSLHSLPAAAPRETLLPVRFRLR